MLLYNKIVEQILIYFWGGYIYYEPCNYFTKILPKYLHNNGQNRIQIPQHSTSRFKKSMHSMTCEVGYK